MTIILTAPARLELMCMDAHEDIKSARADYVEQLDEAMRPSVIIELGDGTYEGFAQNIVDGTEVFTVSVVGEVFGRGRGKDNEHETQVREIVAALIRYFFSHSQLQFTNDRGLEDSALPALAGAMFHRIRRGPITLMERGAETNFYGCMLTVEITEREEYKERLVGRT